MTEKQILNRLNSLRHWEAKLISEKTGITTVSLSNYKNWKQKINMTNFNILKEYFENNK